MLSLGATPVFADVSPDTYVIDPKDIEHRVTPNTKAILVVHYGSMPCDMDPIAKRHGLKVIEDVSHAQGGLYKGRMLGTIGDAAGISLMAGKPLVAGEGGMLLTNDRLVYERVIAFGHYERTFAVIEDPSLKPYAGMPIGGHKYRMNQLSSALGRTQLRHYRERMVEIQKAMNYFWDHVEDLPGIVAIRPPKDSGSTMGGWYSPMGIYRSQELGGLPLKRFIGALRAEGVRISAGANHPIHLHPLMNDCDVYGNGAPTRIAHAARDVRQGPGSLPVTEAAMENIYKVPWFKKFMPDHIDQYALAFRKISDNFKALL